MLKLTVANASRQAAWLHTFDPKALYNIAIKDQDVWSKNGGKLK